MNTANALGVTVNWAQRLEVIQASSLVFEISAYIRISYIPSRGTQPDWSISGLTVINHDMRAPLFIVESSADQSMPAVAALVCQDTGARVIIYLLPCRRISSKIGLRWRALPSQARRARHACVNAFLRPPLTGRLVGTTYTRSPAITALSKRCCIA